MAEEPQWRVMVRVPVRLSNEQIEALFDSVATAVHEWEPAERHGWDADVSATLEDDSLEAGYDRLARTLEIKQRFECALIDGIGMLNGEHLDEFAERIVRELQSWRCGARWHSLPRVESVPDATATAAALARESWDDEADHGELMRSAAGKLAAINEAACLLLAERDVLRWLHAEAVHRAAELEAQRDSLAAMLERMDTEHTVFCGPDGEEIHPDWCRECRVSELKAAIADIDAHATPVGLLNNDDPDGSPHHYLLTVGALHRALGKAYTAERCEAERSRLRADVERERSSRQAWAAEAMRQEMELAKFREITLDGNALYSAMLVGIGGEHDDPPSNEQIERALRLWENRINRELRRPDWHPKSACGRGDACDQHGALFRHSDGTPCWGCQICLESEEDAAEDDGTRPVCAVHPEAKGWQPGDPVYPDEREDSGAGACSDPECGVTWSPAGPTECPRCGSPAMAGTPWAEGGEPE